MKKPCQRNDLQNDVVQTITTYMVQGWIREVNQSLLDLVCWERLGEFYT